MIQPPRNAEAAGGGEGWQSALRLLGLGMRARTVAVGVQGVRQAAMKGAVRLVIMASDVSENSRDKLIPLLQARRITLLIGPNTVSLGAAVGKSAVAAIGILDGNLATGVQNALAQNSSEAKEE